MDKANRHHHDYYASYHTYQIVKGSTNMTLKAFCEDQNLSYDYTRRKFAAIRKDPGKANTNMEAPKAQGKRTRQAHDWEAYRIEFLEGDFETIAAFLRSKGLKPGTGICKKKTKGWAKEKARIEAQKREKMNDEILEKEKRKRLGELEGKVLAGLYKCLDGYEIAQKCMEKYQARLKTAGESIPLMKPKELKYFVSAISVIQQGLIELFQLIRNFEQADCYEKLLQRVMRGEIDIVQAGLQYAAIGGSIPEVLRILLNKVQPEEPDTLENEFPDDEELERRFQEGIARIKTQEVEFLAQRQREVEQLKEETKAADSFSNEAADQVDEHYA
ncbi:MAG: hypothetical protein K9M96_07325 [Deltaproteobacteria bacterium]|nr:hypothetical protein [Deltaproteobacteria bacterium]